MVSFEEQPGVLRMSGDEDRSTQWRRRPSFSRAIRARADVVVDLSALHFADASLMVDLAVLAQRLRAHGRALRLCNAQPHIRTLIEMVGLHRLPSISLDAGPALASA